MGADINLSANGLGVLSAFEPYKKYLNVIRGVSMNNGAQNHAAIRAMLTGFVEGTANGVAVDSIDNTIASALRRDAVRGWRAPVHPRRWV